MPEKTETFQEMIARRDRILGQSEIREITGVIRSGGSGGSGTRGKDPWQLTFGFAAWKLDNGEVQKLPLFVHKELPETELRRIMEQINPYSVLRIKAHFAVGILPNRAEAQLVEFIGSIDSDTELNRAAEELQKPVTFRDEQFGEFTLDRRIHWFSAQTTWNSEPVQLVLHVEDDLDYARALQIARLLWDVQSEWTEKVCQLAVSKYLGIKNSAWLEEGDELVSEEEFRQRMKLKTVAVTRLGNLEFWFEDGDLFWGHEILVQAKLAEGPTEAKLVG